MTVFPARPISDAKLGEIVIQTFLEKPRDVFDLYELDPFGRLDNLPDGLRGLTGVRSIRMGKSRIAHLPPWLSNLPELRMIDARNSPLKSIPPLPGVHLALNVNALLDCVSTLKFAMVHSIKITSDATPQAIRFLTDLSMSGQLKLSSLSIVAPFRQGEDVQRVKQLWAQTPALAASVEQILAHQPHLQEFRVVGFSLSQIPWSLRGASKLRRLSLVGMWHGPVPEWLFDLPQLSMLELVHNGITRIPSRIGNARRLKTLNLSHNPLTAVPSGIWDLSGLVSLDLLACPIQSIPSDILRLESLTDLRIGPDSAAYSTGPQSPPGMVVPPPEVAANGLEAIKSYWQQRQESGKDYLSEAKLLIVGEPGAGKTSLAKKILDPEYTLDHTEASTEGIDVLAWYFPAAVRIVEADGEHLLERDFRVNVWDFGGQEIYHSTHQFFLTKRSVYVLVSDERREDTDFQYWLEVINLLSAGSPLLVIQNRKHGRTQALDLSTLRQSYPALVGTLSVDLSDNSGLTDAVARIRRELESLPHIGTALPKTWRAVRMALEGDPRNYISAEEFFSICRAHGFTDDAKNMRQLGGFLHDLGICLYFQDDPLLKNTVILKPEWGTGAVYRVLDDQAIIEGHGVFGADDLRRIWREPTYQDMHDELVQLMVKFALCYPVPGLRAWVAPQLLAPGPPEYEWDGAGELALRYEYAVMPKGIVRRLIVDLHDLIEGDAVWRTGVVFARGADRAEIVEDYHRKRLRIRLTGPDPRPLLALIDRALDAIHRSYPEIKFFKYRPCDCPVCRTAAEPSMYKVNELEDFALTGDQIQCRVSHKMVDPIALLSQLLDPGAMRAAERALNDLTGDARETKAPPEVFVSYKWGGAAEEVVNELHRELNRRGLHVRRDRNELNYREPIRMFMRRLGDGKSVVIVLDKAYLESPYCMFELTEIARRPEFAKRIYPIVMPDAGLFSARNRVAYIRFWEEMIDELNTEMRSVSQENLQGIREEIDLYGRIRAMIATIMEVLGDMNTLTPEMHRQSGFEQLYKALAGSDQVR